MTDEALDELMRRVETGDREAQMQIDAWIEEALGSIRATAPIDQRAERADLDSLPVRTVCCGSCSGAFAE